MAKNDRRLSEDEIAAYAARMERLRRAHEGYRESASGGSAANNDPADSAGSDASDPTNPSPPTASGSGSGGNHQPPKPPQPPPFPGGEGDALKKLLEAAQKLSQAADKLDKTADKLGKGEGGTTKDLGNKDESDKGLSGWAKNYLNHIGNKLGASVEDKSVKTFGEGVGRPLGKFMRGRIGKGIGKLTNFGRKRRKPSGTGSIGRLGTADRSAASAEGAAAAGGEAAAAGGAEAAGVEAAVGADAALASTGVGAPVAIAIAGVIACGVALKKLHDIIIDATKAQQEANFKLADFSAAMAAVQAQAHIAETLRNMEKGDQLAGTAGMLNDSYQHYQDNTKEMEVLLGNIKNILLSIGTETIAQLLEPLAVLSEKANEFISLFFQEQKGISASDFLDKVRKDADEARRRGDEWFRRRDYGHQRRDEEI